MERTHGSLFHWLPPPHPTAGKVFPRRQAGRQGVNSINGSIGEVRALLRAAGKGEGWVGHGLGTCCSCTRSRRKGGNRVVKKETVFGRNVACLCWRERTVKKVAPIASSSSPSPDACCTRAQVSQGPNFRFPQDRETQKGDK